MRNSAKNERKQQGKHPTLTTEWGWHTFQNSYACKSMLPLKAVLANCALHIQKTEVTVHGAEMDFEVL